MMNRIAAIFIHEDDQIIVLEKPFNIHCHPLKYTEKDNCLSYLRSESLGKYLEVNKSKQGEEVIKVPERRFASVFRKVKELCRERYRDEPYCKHFN